MIARNGRRPRVDPSARVAASAQIVGDVTLGARCFVDHNVVIESAGPPIEIGAQVIVFAGSVLRSVGGSGRPPFGLSIGERSLVAPLCALAGCQIGRNCYIATGSIILQGAVVGNHTRVGAGAIVHAGTELPERARIGMRHVAAPTEDGFLSTPDVDQVRTAALTGGFFEAAFGAHEKDQVRLHEELIGALLEEVHGWADEPA